MLLKYRRTGSIVSLRVEAKDADGVPLALMVLDAPAGASFGEYGDGTRTSIWHPRQGDEGLHTITFLARDHALPDVTTTLRVEILTSGNYCKALTVRI